ncbi:MAG: cell division protein FtsA [Parcubacteria group bacterium]|nr:cell division protein FtsA [Parcubacteria group bacterium]
MARIYTGIDIGTSQVKVLIATSDAGGLRIAATATAPTKGMRQGYIINIPDITNSIREAVDRAEKAANVRVRSARIAIGGVGIDELRSTGEISLTASGGEVTDRDVQRAIQESEKRASAKLTNRKVIHAIPLAYRIDTTDVLGRPTGMKGTKLAVDTLLITAFEQHVHDLIAAVEAAHIEVEDVMASPLAASLVTLTKPQKMIGVMLANIGAETVSLVVFENDTPISIKVLPTGSSDITADLALTFKIPLIEAEQMKRGAVSTMDVPRKKIDDVINNRLKEICALIDAHLKAMGKQRLLPAGIVMVGGGSGVAAAADIARSTLRLPSSVGSITPVAGRAIAGDALWAVAYGLCRWGFITDQKDRERGMSYITENIKEYMGKMFRSFLP